MKKCNCNIYFFPSGYSSQQDSISLATKSKMHKLTFKIATVD